MPDLTFEEAMKIFPPLYTIYYRPADFPGHEYVVRLRAGMVLYPLGMPAKTLEEARAIVQQAGGEVCLNRAPSDDPCIVESWI